MLPERLEVIEQLLDRDKWEVRVGDMWFRAVGNVWLNAMIPLDSPDVDEFPKFCQDVLEMMLSEETNNDACETLVHIKASPPHQSLYVTVVIIDWLT